LLGYKRFAHGASGTDVIEMRVRVKERAHLEFWVLARAEIAQMLQNFRRIVAGVDESCGVGPRADKNAAVTLEGADNESR
jgi:hypothetical protein